MRNLFDRKIKPTEQKPVIDFTMKSLKLEQFKGEHLPALILKESELLAIDKEIEAYVIAVNDLIDKYNSTTTTDKRIEFFQEINNKIKEMDNNYTEEFYHISPTFRAGQAALFKQLRNQARNLGMDSMAEGNKPSNSLAGIIANMSPDKADGLLKILVENGKAKNTIIAKKTLLQLYDNDKSDEAEFFRSFCDNHKFSVISVGNSINFLVTDNKGENAKVLKVDAHLFTPRNAEVHLRNRISLKDRFSTIEAERQVSALFDQGRSALSRTLIVADYYPQGSLDRQMSEINTDKDILINISNIFPQMASTLQDLQNAGCMFPDCKISNWLLTDKGTLIIADTKSLVFTDKKGNYSDALPGNRWHAFISTRGYEAGSENADHAHACILGRNLYEFATGSQIQGFNTRGQFTQSIFQTPQGKTLQRLIENLIVADPSARMSVREAMDELFILQNPKFQNVLISLKASKFGSNDYFMNEYILTKQKEVMQATPAEKDKILEEMQLTASALKNAPAVVQSHSLINNLRVGSSWYTKGYLAKAQRIEDAMVNLPIESRIHFNPAENFAVMEAVASHRHVGKEGKHLSKDKSTIVEKNAASTYTEFKKKFDEQRADCKGTKSSEQNSASKEEETRGLKP